MPRLPLLPLLVLQLLQITSGAELNTCNAHVYESHTTCIQSGRVEYSYSGDSDGPDPPGFTRSVYERDHALIAPDSHVFSALGGWTNAEGAYLVTPAIGSHFTMYIVRMGASSASAPPLPGVERLVFVLSGRVSLVLQYDEKELLASCYAYLPPHFNHTLYSEGPLPATFLVLERRYLALQTSDRQPEFLAGTVDDRPLVEARGEVFDLRKLLPSDPVYDFNIHIMDFQQGDYLNVKEVHYFQHGLFLLEGQGIYRLGNHWYPVRAGDAIWMAPFVPQWYGALGRTRSRYFLYKDLNRDPLLHPYEY